MLPNRILRNERLYFRINNKTQYKISSIFQVIMHKIAQLISTSLILLQTLEKVLYGFVFVNASQSTFIILNSSHMGLLSVIAIQ